ncbi:hypothetical protein J2Z66_003176 [Paenibacillus eucommiae]|uniref:Uncharacterized protein n=1 Tax=Paenibacillus eucommiae TaxID=1355755 RepID=A0ABS4IVG1_9BACL|nr:hypothetical protein [Paenibacillus eucommiae]
MPLFNAGIAIGAFLGGIVTAKMGLIHTTWVGALMVLGAVILTGWARKLERKDEAALKKESLTASLKKSFKTSTEAPVEEPLKEPVNANTKQYI